MKAAAALLACARAVAEDQCAKRAQIRGPRIDRILVIISREPNRAGRTSAGGENFFLKKIVIEFGALQDA